MRKPDIRAQVSMWYPQAGQVAVRPHHQPGLTGISALRWYLEIGPVSICVGATGEDLDEDLAAMRALADAAAEIAGLLEERAAAVTA